MVSKVRCCADSDQCFLLCYTLLVSRKQPAIAHRWQVLSCGALHLWAQSKKELLYTYSKGVVLSELIV